MSKKRKAKEAFTEAEIHMEVVMQAIISVQQKDVAPQAEDSIAFNRQFVKSYVHDNWETLENQDIDIRSRNFGNIPGDIVFEILSHLRPYHLMVLPLVCRSWKRSLELIDYKMHYLKAYGIPTSTQQTQFKLDTNNNGWRLLFAKRKSLEINLSSPGFQPRVVYCKQIKSITNQKKNGHNYMLHQNAACFVHEVKPSSNFFAHFANLSFLNLDTQETYELKQDGVHYKKCIPLTGNLFIALKKTLGRVIDAKTQECKVMFELFNPRGSPLFELYDSKYLLALHDECICIYDFETGRLLCATQPINIGNNMVIDKMFIDGDRLIMLALDGIGVVSISTLIKNLNQQGEVSSEIADVQVIPFQMTQIVCTSSYHMTTANLLNYNTFGCVMFNINNRNSFLETVSLQEHRNLHILQSSNSALFEQRVVDCLQGILVGASLEQADISPLAQWSDTRRNHGRIWANQLHGNSFLNVVSPTMCFRSFRECTPFVLSVQRSENSTLQETVPWERRSRWQDFSEYFSSDYSRLYHIDDKICYVLDMTRPAPAVLCPHVGAVSLSARNSWYNLESPSYWDCLEESTHCSQGRVMCLVCGNVYCDKCFNKHMAKKPFHHMGCQAESQTCVSIKCFLCDLEIQTNFGVACLYLNCVIQKLTRAMTVLGALNFILEPNFDSNND